MSKALTDLLIGMIAGALISAYIADGLCETRTGENCFIGFPAPHSKGPNQ